MQQAQHAHMDAVLEEAIEASNHVVTEDEPLIMPVFTEDYFRQQGVELPDELPDQIEDLKKDEPAGGLMVMMSFTEWLLHFRTTSQKEKEEGEAQRALKAMWQKEKLAEAMGEENDEIPENVFEMAVTSIAKEDGLASESLANIYHKQGKYEQALDMYRKLSLRNPQKNAYFAAKIEEILKEKQS
jgi:tetratricopeptide (TPR) repeat protein